jgi:hypothetical protein
MRSALLTFKVVNRESGITEYIHTRSTATKPVVGFVSGAQSVVKLVDEALHRIGALASQVDRLAAGVFVVHHDIDWVRLLSLCVVFHDLDLLFALKPSNFCLTGAHFQFSCLRIT